MENELIAARLRRDSATYSFLTRKQEQYAEIEDDVAPLRAQLGTNLTRANSFKDQVLAADSDNNAARKKGFRNQLTALLLRRVKALRAHAKGAKPEPDLDLFGTLPSRPADIRRLTEGEFPTEAKRLLGLGADVPAAALAKRRYTAKHHEDALKLLAKFGTTTEEGETNDDLGATGRQALERLIKANARLIASLQEFFAPYNDEEDEEALALYTEWRQAIAVNFRGGHDGPLGGEDDNK